MNLLNTSFEIVIAQKELEAKLLIEKAKLKEKEGESLTTAKTNTATSKNNNMLMYIDHLYQVFLLVCRIILSTIINSSYQKSTTKR